MGCLDDNTIAAFVEHRLGPEEAQAVEEHVDTCAGCRALLAGLARLLAPTTDPHTPALGLAIDVAPEGVMGRYLILRRLGAGGMGVVYLAYDPTLDRQIALKVMRPPEDDGGARRASARLLREARAMAKLAHPNIAAVFDAGWIDGQPFIAMELLEGGTLTEYLRAPRSRREVLAAFTAAGRGLEAAHHAGLVHRDFKPDNVLFSGQGRVCVSDFGLVDVLDPDGGDVERRRPGVPVRTCGGTPGYMAPEQQLGRPTDARSDQYSFCVALYAALYGEPPFAGESAEARLEDALHDRVRPASPSSRVPSWLRQVIRRGLRADPRARFPTMDALLRALGGDPWIGRRRALAGVVIALIATAGAIRIIRRPPAPPLSDVAGALAAARAPDGPAEADRSRALLRAAATLKEEYRKITSRQQDSFGEADFAPMTRIIDAILAVDETNGHALYYSGEKKRWLNKQNRYGDGYLRSHADFYKYLEEEKRVPPGGSTSADACYEESPHGYCAQRTAWIRHLLAVDFHRSGCMARDRDVKARYFAAGMAHVNEELRLYGGFDDPTQQPTTEVLKKWLEEGSCGAVQR